jgi:hypothetical protein
MGVSHSQVCVGQTAAQGRAWAFYQVSAARSLHWSLPRCFCLCCLLACGLQPPGHPAWRDDISSMTFADTTPAFHTYQTASLVTMLRSSRSACCPGGCGCCLQYAMGQAGAASRWQCGQAVLWSRQAPHASPPCAPAAPSSDRPSRPSCHASWCWPAACLHLCFTAWPPHNTQGRTQQRCEPGAVTPRLAAWLQPFHVTPAVARSQCLCRA